MNYDKTEQAWAEDTRRTADGTVLGEAEAFGPLMDRLGKGIAVLTEILGPILMDTEPIEDPPMAALAATPRCTLSRQMRGTASELGNIAERIERLISRVAIS